MPREGMIKNNSNQAAAGFIRVKNLKKGTEISAIYQGSYTDKKYGKLNHRLELVANVTLPIQADKKSPVTQTKFKIGDLVILNSSGSLDKSIVKYPVGADIDVVYAGTATLTSGQFKGEEFHQFEIYHAAGTTLSAAGTNGSETAASETSEDPERSEDVDF